MLFIETSVFTSQVTRALSKEEYRALQLALVLRPEQGAVIRGSGGLRKVRWRERGTGKRGGIRVIYYWAGAEETIYLLFLYRKARQSDLTQEQIQVLRRIVREELE